MFKRVERKRKRREEDEELGLDQATKETIGLNDTDSDESDSGLDDENAQSDDSDAGIGEDWHREEDAASEDEGVGEDPPVSVAEALKDPIYLISFDPTIHGCVLCKGKLIKNTGMVAAHKNANAHKRRFEHFRLLSADADPRSNAWELVRTIHPASHMQSAGTQELSKRALKRQVRQAALHEKRKRHKELKAKAMAKKTSSKLSTTDETRPAVPSSANLRSSLGSQNQPRKTRKKKRLESNTNVDTITETRNVTAKSLSRIETSGDRKKPVRTNPMVKTKTSREAKKPS